MIYNHIPSIVPLSQWCFRSFVDDRGRCLVEKWLEKKVSKQGRARMDACLKQLRDKPKEMWKRPQASPAGDGIYVIHFHDENRTQHRPIGHFLDEYRAFVITVTAIEKDGEYDPSDYIDTASRRRDTVNSDPQLHSAAVLGHISAPFMPTEFQPTSRLV